MQIHQWSTIFFVQVLETNASSDNVIVRPNVEKQCVRNTYGSGCLRIC